MKSVLARLSSLWRFPGWFPEIVIIRSSRIRNQVRMLALAGLVGIVAGVGCDCLLCRHASRASTMRWAFSPVIAQSLGRAVNRRWPGCRR